MSNTSAQSPGERRRGRGRPAIARDTPLLRADILRQARVIVADEGLAALTIRRLASDLGVTAMSIYHHVEDKPHLLAAVVSQIWDEIFADLEYAPVDFVEWGIQLGVHTRKVWLENVELASLAMAVPEADEQFLAVAAIGAFGTRAAGFTDLGLAFSALQTFTLGSIAIAANRRLSSATLGRDPADTLRRVHELLDHIDAPPDQRVIVDARFDVDADARFEAGLRALVTGLLVDLAPHP